MNCTVVATFTLGMNASQTIASNYRQTCLTKFQPFVRHTNAARTNKLLNTHHSTSVRQPDNWQTNGLPIHAPFWPATLAPNINIATVILTTASAIALNEPFVCRRRPTVQRTQRISHHGARSSRYVGSATWTGTSGPSWPTLWWPSNAKRRSECGWVN